MKFVFILSHLLILFSLYFIPSKSNAFALDFFLPHYYFHWVLNEYCYIIWYLRVYVLKYELFSRLIFSTLFPMHQNSTKNKNDMLRLGIVLDVCNRLHTSIKYVLIRINMYLSCFPKWKFEYRHNVC